jgi:NACalpha-BTF3-like transcription factor
MNRDSFSLEKARKASEDFQTNCQTASQMHENLLDYATNLQLQNKILTEENDRLREQLYASRENGFRGVDSSKRSSKTPTEPASMPEDVEVVDESGCDPKDIELVASQAGCTRAAAVKALCDNDHDIVASIMELTT